MTTTGGRTPPDGRRPTKSPPEGPDSRPDVLRACTAFPSPPKGAWQEPTLTLTECTRHQGRCAYRQGDPTRCDACHATWHSITHAWQDATSRVEHLAQHARIDEIRRRAIRRVAPTP